MYGVFFAVLAAVFLAGAFFVLDALFVERGAGNADWRTSLSREADERFGVAARQLAGACLVSWWRHRGAAGSGTPTEWLSTLSIIRERDNCCHVIVQVLELFGYISVDPVTKVEVGSSQHHVISSIHSFHKPPLRVIL